MTAVLIPASSEAEWLQARRQGVTASEIAVVMGLAPESHGSAYKLYHQKLGILPPGEDAPELERGRVLEPYIAEKFAALHPEFTVGGDGRTLFAHPDRPWQLATPDRFACEILCGSCGQPGCPYTSGPLAVVECKSDGGSDEWGEPGTDEIPVHYRCQALWQMRVMGVDLAYVACLRIRQWDIRVYEISLDADALDDLQLMEREARDFLDRIDTLDPPDVDWRPATTGALKTLHAEVEDREVLISRRLAISYRAAVRRHKEAERRKDEMTNRVLAAMGTAKHAVEQGTGLPLASRSVSHPKRINPALLREKYPAIAAECTPEPEPVIKLTPARARKGTTS